MLTSELDCLKSMPLFRGVDVAKLKLIALSGQREMHEQGDVVAEQGRIPESVFILISGEIEVLRRVDKGDVRIARFERGYVIGDIAVIIGEPHPATFKTTKPTEVLRIDANSFLQLVRDVPQVSFALLQDFGRRVIRLSQIYVAEHQ